MFLLLSRRLGTNFQFSEHQTTNKNRTLITDTSLNRSPSRSLDNMFLACLLRELDAGKVLPSGDRPWGDELPDLRRGSAFRLRPQPASAPSCFRRSWLRHCKGKRPSSSVMDGGKILRPFFPAAASQTFFLSSNVADIQKKVDRPIASYSSERQPGLLLAERWEAHRSLHTSGWLARAVLR